MKNSKFWLITCIIMMLSGIGLATAGTMLGGKWNMRFDFKNFKVVTSSGESVTDSVLIKESISKLEFETGTIDISVKSGNEFKVEYKVPEELKPEIETVGNTLKIRTPDQNGFSLFNFLYTSDEESYIYITVPEDIKDFDIDLESSTGDININDLPINGMIEVSTGDILLNNITAKNLNIVMSTGDVFITDSIISNSLKTDGSTGIVNIKNSVINGKYEAETSTGDITVNNSELSFLEIDGSTSDITVNHSKISDGVHIETSTGDVSLKIDGKEDDYRIKLHTSTGDMMIAGNEKDGKDFEKSNGSKELMIETSTGDITIDFE